MSLGQLIGPELKTLLEEDPEQFLGLLDDIHPQDLADVVPELEPAEAARTLTTLPPEYAAQVFERLEEEDQQALASTWGTEMTTQIAVEMDPDDLADFITVLPQEMRQDVLSQLQVTDPETAQDLRDLRSWDESSAGGLMTTAYLSVRPNMTLREASEHIRGLADEAETLDCVYVTDAEEHLLGLLTMRRMLLTPGDAIVEDVMLHNVKTVRPELYQEDVAHKLAKYDLSTLPVVSEDGQLLGVITADDVLDVMTEEQSEDVHKMGAIEPIRDGYLETDFATFLRKRAPWLVILFVGGFMTTQTMQAYESELSAVTQLAFYLPLLISAGGNSGSQSSTLVIRALAVGDITAVDWAKVLSREFLQGLALGVLLATFGVLRALLSGDGMEFAVLVGATITAIVAMGCMVGALAPILLHRAGFDPATSSTPFIATLVDVMGIVVYLTLARSLLSALASAAH